MRQRINLRFRSTAWSASLLFPVIITRVWSQRTTRLALWGPSSAQGRRLAHRVYLARSFPTRQHSAFPSSLDRRARRRNDSIVHRHASIVLAPTASPQGAVREDMQGDYAEAILVPKLVQRDLENRSFAKGDSMTHTCLGEMSTGTHRLLRHIDKEIGELLYRGNLNIVALRRSYKEKCAGCLGELLCERAELSCRKVCVGRGPVIIDLPQWLGSKCGKREPIVKFVLLKISKGDK
jgi:hypothetical protein